MKKEFMRYIIPSMLSFMLSGVYSIVDGIFIGNAMGDHGLTAINIVWPLISVIISLGTGIGMGAAVLISLRTGAGKEEEARQAEGNAMVLLVIGAILLILILYLFGRPLISLLGGKGIVLDYAHEYLRYILLGGIIQVCATGMIPLLRNRGAALYAMLSMVAGCMVNIVLDWYLIAYLDGGMKGAALATVAGQVVTLLLCIIFYSRKKNRLPWRYLRPRYQMIKPIIRIGISPFGLTFLPSITIVCMNLQTLKYGGMPAVSTYAVLAYILSFMELIIQGVSDGAQPLISKSKGSGNHKELKQYRNWMFLFVGVIGLTGGLIVYAMRSAIPVLYGTSAEVAAMVIDTTYLFSLVMILYGVSKAAISYLYAIDRTRPSSFLVYSEVVLTIAMIIILPQQLGLMGVWLTMPAVQAVLAVLSIILVGGELCIMRTKPLKMSK